MQVSTRITMFALLINVAAATAQDVPSSWGVRASTHWAECTLAGECNSSAFVLGLTAINETSSAGGVNQTMAEQLDITQNGTTFNFDDIVMGTASAAAELDLAQAAVPVLRASASAVDDRGWVSGFAFAIAGWHYTGPPGTVELSALLDGFVTNPVGIDTTALSVAVFAVRDDGSEVFPNPAPSTIGELFAAIDELPVEDSWQPADLTAPGSVTPQAVSVATPVGDPITITFSADDIANGDTGFYIVAGLVAGATYDGHSADAMSTLTMQFADSSNLVSAVQSADSPSTRAVPIPLPALLLLAIGLAAGGARLQRRRGA